MRTDLVSACPECRTRTAPLEHCPTCDTSLVDLRDAESARQILEAARQRDIAQLPAIRTRRGIAAVIAALGFSAFVATQSSSLIAAVPLVLVAIVTGAFLWVHVVQRGVARRLGPDHLHPAKPNVLLASPPPFELEPRPNPKALPGPTSSLLRGRVRARTRQRSPLAGSPCVAFRLVGSCGAYFVDDAGGDTFDVLVEGADSDASFAVELGHAVVACPAATPEALDDRARPDLDAFLAGRGIVRGRLTLAESLLCDGDTVEIEGPSEILVEAGAYREGTYVRTFRGTAEQPVRITRL